VTCKENGSDIARFDLFGECVDLLIETEPRDIQSQCGLEPAFFQCLSNGPRIIARLLELLGGGKIPISVVADNECHTFGHCRARQANEYEGEYDYGFCRIVHGSLPNRIPCVTANWDVSIT